MKKNIQKQQGVQQQQSSLVPQVLGELAICWVNAAGVAYRSQRGFSSAAPIHNGAGDFTLTLQDAIPTTAGVLITCGLNSTGLGDIAVEVVSATTLRVRTASMTPGGPPVIAAADLDFWVRVQEFSPN